MQQQTIKGQALVVRLKGVGDVGVDNQCEQNKTEKQNRTQKKPALIETSHFLICLFDTNVCEA